MANKKKNIKKKSQSVKRKKKNDKSKRKNKKKYIYGFLLLIIGIVIAMSIYHVFKPLPHGVSKLSSETMTDHVELLTDVTYKNGNKMQYNQEIFDKVNETIKEADDFIIMDMFLFNHYQTGDKT
ncbi:hypothetical protein, partial [Actinomyces bowdenii]|nr:hypothetical protein [Actinomyces bowdenii]NYS70579.1 hypothetical protein [Actinomyces bowdenii]